ncbi:hypothetical protein K9U34_06895 [Lawsonia intracellularis]|uniref:hypothetical protein n=1 Tax=Lawsonia intracellularis TaxID=29546 RepID=UPI0002F0E863|nr:hypothetical protein [Lawsonia intracellularis]MBZ3893318.1 hypothetical protein [Lawsonia intracellularis]UYH53653.1 hypothetical protein OCT60_06670 [Lawsonia intracellularis]
MLELCLRQMGFSLSEIRSMSVQEAEGFLECRHQQVRQQKMPTTYLSLRQR